MSWLKSLFGVSPPTPHLSAARRLVVQGDYRAAIAEFDAHLKEHDDDVQAYAELARALVATGREDEAAEFVFELEERTPTVWVAKGETYAALEEPEEALKFLGKARDFYERELKQNFNTGYARGLYDDVSRLYDALYAEVRGHEQVVVDHARRGKLDGRSGVNYALLGDSLMVDSQHRPETLWLESVAETRRRLESLSKEARAGVRGPLLEGTIALREGRVDDAAEAFEIATARDGTHFAAFRGLGAAKSLSSAGWPRSLAALRAPHDAPWDGLETVAPDLPNFTALERTIVLCSLAPLRFAVPHLARANKSIRVMPLDVRATDHEEFAGDHRFEDDHRALSALSGVASRKLALVRLDTLLDAGVEHGWVFGHEFAHLAHRHLAPELRDEVMALYTRAARSGYAVSAYALKNVQEFFAVLYEQYLSRRYELATRSAADDLGVVDGMMALFERLGEAPEAFVPG